MPVTTSYTPDEYVGNGSVKTFSYTFKILDEGDLRVYHDGVLVSSSNYSVTGVGDEGGGDITHTTAPASGVVVRLERSVSINRTTDYTEGGGLASKTIDDDFDRQIMIDQQLDYGNINRVAGSDDWDADGAKITNLADPTSSSDAATKGWSETSGSSYVSQARSARDAAQTAQTAAEAAQTGAETAETNAETAETNAVTAKNAAETAQTNAETAETNAETAESHAQEWADQNEDTEITFSAGDYSAKHHAAKASASASAASTSASNAATSESNAAASESNAQTFANDAANTLATFQDQYHGALASAPSGSPGPDEGDLYFDTSVNKMRVYDGSAWADVGSSSSEMFEYSVTGTQTSFSGIDDNGNGLAYTAGFILVFRNGVRLDTTDYTASDGSTVVLDEAAVDGDTISILSFGTFNVADAYTKTQANANFAPITRSRKNKIINGNFDIWQRGTSFTNVSSGQYTADRWVRQFGDETWNVSRQSFTPGQTDVPNNPKYFLRVEQTAVTAASIPWLVQKIEDVTRLSGKTMTLSFWIKANATTAADVYYRQSFGSGGSPQTLVSVSSIGVSTSWEKKTVTFTISSVSGKTITESGDNSTWIILMLPDNTTVDIDIAQVQLEEGSVATDFEQRMVGEELALCQRYYIDTGERSIWQGYVQNSTSYSVMVYLPTTMRTSPTITTSHDGSTNFPTTGPITAYVGKNSFRAYLTSSTGPATGSFVFYYTADAEL